MLPRLARMKQSCALALLAISTFLCSNVTAAPKPVDRVANIQTALRKAGLDGWLFYNFRGNDPLARRILLLDDEAIGSRRWFYYIPAEGECSKIVHRIEPAKLASLPGRQIEYSSWKELQAALREALPTDKTN